MATVAKLGMKARTLSTFDEYGYFYSEETIGFGNGVMRGTDKEKQCKNMVTGGQFLGVAADRATEFAGAKEYPASNTVEVIRKGYVWVKVDGSAVVAGDKAACGASGKFAKAGTATYDEVVGATFETSAAKNGLAILRLK